jgi:hypothetical protein
MECTRIAIQASMHRDGMRKGTPMQFETITQAENYFANSDGVLPFPIIRVAWNEKIPANANGMVLEEIRTRHTPEDQSTTGTRIFA